MIQIKRQTEAFRGQNATLEDVMERMLREFETNIMPEQKRWIFLRAQKIQHNRGLSATCLLTP